VIAAQLFMPSKSKAKRVRQTSNAFLERRSPPFALGNNDEFGVTIGAIIA
jgi:hypothetical protein